MGPWDEARRRNGLVGTYSAPPWSPADTGTHVIAMTFDPSNVYPEVDETNNTDTMVVHVTEGNLRAP